MTVSNPSRNCSCASDNTALELQNALLQAITVLTQLVSQLASQVHQCTKTEDAEPWMEERDNAVNPSIAPRSSANLTPFWDELSVKKLRSFLRSYPIDRSSLPAPIELLRRSELIEALNQIQALGA
jgi:hypothetical protein